MDYELFDKQSEALECTSLIKGIFAAKRSGKSEACYVEDILKAKNQQGFTYNGRDPYVVGIIAPTERMLRRLVWPKFRAMSRPFEQNFNKTDHIYDFKKPVTSPSQIMGFSAEKIERMEGHKINHIHMTEVFQMKEFAFLEALARTSDSGGTITMEGSLGANIPNPKATWVYKRFKENCTDEATIFEWATADNPYFPRDRLRRMANILDSRSFKQMFKISWDAVGSAIVYDEFDEANIIDTYQFDKSRETYIVIDWGWNCPMAVIFIQYDRRHDVVYIFDEIVQSRLKLPMLWEKIQVRRYPVKEWICDIAGKREDERPIASSIKWFQQAPRNIHFNYRTSRVNDGVGLIRPYIKTGLGRRKLYISRAGCPNTIDAFLNYSYLEKNGMIINETPHKDGIYDNPMDAVRYFFVNKLPQNKADSFGELPRWG